MTPRELRIVSALAVFLSAALPAAAGAIAFRSQPILAATLRADAGALPGLTGLYFNHFTGMLIGLLVIGLGITAYAARAHLRDDEEPIVRMAKLLVATCFSALVSVVFLGLLVLATALPVYAKLMER
ncbi:MAG: hypothetical protein RI910_541 [Verrucomicrobiota bacterium]|jgi:hypothetical protein